MMEGGRVFGVAVGKDWEFLLLVFPASGSFIIIICEKYLLFCK